MGFREEIATLSTRLGSEIKALRNSMTPAIPAGVLHGFGGSVAPSGYLLCDGSAVSRTTYSALFSAIGINYGAGNGSTTFNVPNTKGRILAGYDVSDSGFNALGKTGGAKTVTLTQAQLASHTHSQTAHAHTQGTHTHSQSPHSHGVVMPGSLGGSYAQLVGDYAAGGSGSAAVPTSQSGLSAVGSPAYASNTTPPALAAVSPTINNTTPPALGNTGSDSAHENMPPYIVVNYIIKT